MTIETHELVFTPEGNGQFTAECSCGRWAQTYNNYDQDVAAEDFDNHCDVVFMEATGF